MTRLEALIELRDKVKAGCIARSDLDAFIPVFGLTIQGNDAHSAYKGSLDAAKALHEAVLPGWDAQIHLADRGVEIFDGHMFAGYDLCFAAHANNPARAWLIAILEALIAQDKQT